MINKGQLVIKPQSGMLIYDTDLLFSMDPYCVITSGNNRFQTKVHSGGGKSPKWIGESFKMNVTNEDIITFEVWDREHIGSNRMVGQGALALNTAM